MEVKSSVSEQFPPWHSSAPHFLMSKERNCSLTYHLWNSALKDKKGHTFSCALRKPYMTVPYVSLWLYFPSLIEITLTQPHMWQFQRKFQHRLYGHSTCTGNFEVSLGLKGGEKSIRNIWFQNKHINKIVVILSQEHSYPLTIRATGNLISGNIKTRV